ncbi:MAG TPA: SPOR domain-containing protein [Vicinamibacterales bacterium]|nr:SPOR domain-containing protein [Vicinamibacterales bacterium]
MAPRTEDDGFHEIQLSGKQLVFLFMAATLVSVGIFLFGVMVGRGVKAERALAVADASAQTTEPPLPPAAPPAATPAGSDPTAATPPPAVNDLSYFDRLEKPNPPKEDLKPESKGEKAAPKPAPVEKPKPVEKPQPAEKKAAAEEKAPPKPAPAPSKPEPAAPKAATPAPAAASAGDGEFTVQIAALNARGEADSIARRLTSKGYAAYVVPPGNGAVMYRVRVGRFKTRHDAEPIAARLQREEQFKPWITR